MTELMIAGAEKNGISVMNVRHQPLITWLHLLNFATIAILCLLFMKMCKILLVLYRWFFPVLQLPRCPVILVLGPKNDLIQDMVHQLSRIFNSEVTLCQNFYTSEVHKVQKNCKKSRIIYSQIPLSSQEEIYQLKTYIRETFGFVDILVISQNEDPKGGNSAYDFLRSLNEQLLVQFWTVMAFLPGMLRKNSGLIFSIALGKTSSINTGVMRSIHEELLQCDTKVKLILVESNTILDKYYLPSLPSDILASFIVRSMWDSSSLVKVPSLPFYLIMLPTLLLKCLLKPLMKVINLTSLKRF